ncbi:hypothetical protein HDU67_004166 [Dinochytrium kinnereticum]|nr:hypothetical protein HDU67_004166 [Dinochytrium kinnereticum]
MSTPRTQKALILHPPSVKTKPGGDRFDKVELQTVDVPKDVPDGYVLVQMRAAALNHRDVFIRQGLYPNIIADSILGSDGSGVVVGPSKKFEVGARVLINPSCNWKEDVRAPEVPREYGIMGLLPFPGGGVALFALQFAIASGSKAIVTSSDPAKILKAVEMGAVGGVDYRDEAWIKRVEEILGGKEKVDVVVDGAGGMGFAGFLRVLKAGGIISSYGATSGSKTELVLPNLFLKHIDIRGCTMGNEREFADMISFVEEKKIRPIVSGVYELEEYEHAFETMRTSKQFGKLVLRIGGSSKL